jgi:hypothetical protein
VSFLSKLNRKYLLGAVRPACWWIF